MKFGKALNTLLDGRTATWLAAKTGISNYTISLIINDKRTPTIATVEDIAKALKVPAWEIFKLAEQEQQR